MKEVQGGRKGNPMHQTPLKVGKKARRECLTSASALGWVRAGVASANIFFSRSHANPTTHIRK